MTELKIFDEARRRISRGIIERYLHQPGAHWKGNEYWTLNPLRDDRHIGSFHISEIGQWFDHANNEGGDLIDLLCMRHNITKKEAAEKIIEDTGGMPDTKSTKKKAEKPEPLIPIPEEAFQKLNERLESEWSVKQYGEVGGGWKWKDKRGAWCCTVRHEKAGQKDIIPYYYGKDGKWRQGNPVADMRPIYKADMLPEPGTCKILIVEGEKCADVPVDGYFVTTWIGGTGQVKKTKWAALKKHDVTIWSDNDQPGVKAAAYIKEQLPKSRMLKIHGKPDKWDIYDAHKEGINLSKFIQENIDEETAGSAVRTKGEKAHDKGAKADNENGEAHGAGCEIQNAPFLFLGYDESRHYFLPGGANIVKRIGQGSFTKTKLLELAPLSWWLMQYPAKNGVDVDAAIDTTIRDSELHGMFQPERIRGTGVWVHEGRIVVNNGETLTDEYGEPVAVNNRYHYVKSDKRMGDFKGEIATEEQGYNLIELFTAQGFETELEALSLLGWSLISPFGGILKWRPHIWITGPVKSGKSWMLENMIEPLIRPFYHKGTGKTSAPGIYRAIRNTACPILLDEMEPGKNANKDNIQKIEEKLELARNASSDFSSTFTLTSMSGSGLTEEFCVRSCFCFASVLPYFSGEAIESRIVISRLKNIKKTNKVERTKEILKTGIMNDPMIFQRRIFRKLKSIINNIEIAKAIFLKETGDQRRSDNLAPIFSAIIALTYDSDNVDAAIIQKLISKFVNDLAVEKSHTESDEDKLLFELLDYTVQLTPADKLTIAELIIEASKSLDGVDIDNENHHTALQRNGIRMIKQDNVKYLVIASSHSAIKRILSDTMYHSNYYEVLKRHEAKRGNQTVRFAGQTKRAVLLDWDMIRERYFTEHVDDDETGSLFTNEVLSTF
jgi:putative DNA primase/helicase